MTLLARPRPLSRLARTLSGERLALVRTGAGTVMLARPRMMPALLGVDSASSGRMAWVVQMLGAREVALGLGTWAALRTGDVRAQRVWIAAGALSDALDALVVGAAVARGRLSTGPGAAVVLTAGAAAAAELEALRR